MAGRLLKADEEVKNDAEDDKSDERDRDVDESHCSSLDERVVHRGLVVLDDDRTLSEQSRDLGHRRKGSKQHGAVRFRDE